MVVSLNPTQNTIAKLKEQQIPEALEEVADRKLHQPGLHSFWQIDV